MTGKRGRPTKAAQTIADAMRMLSEGNRPDRPRNDIERMVFGQRRGRKPDPRSRTQQAAQFAVQLVRQDGVTQAEAARQAAHVYGVNAANVRKYAARNLNDPSVLVWDRAVAAVAWFGQRPPRPPRRIKLVQEIVDVEPAPGA